MTCAWVLGRRGLLGSALTRALIRRGVRTFHPAEPFDWADQATLASQIDSAISEFASFRRESERWEIYWAAGVGVMASPESVLVPETRALLALTQALRGEPRLRDTPGAIAFASSAGAIYAGSGASLVDEDTPPAPTTAYAREKLRQEEIIRSLIADTPAAGGLIARISTLYGAHQSREKPQGLLTHIARSLLLGQPIRIYVPLDTSRDYIHADDAASLIVATMAREHADQRLVMKIVASGRSTTIAEIVATFKRISRRAPRVITGTRPVDAAYPRLTRFRSIIDASEPNARRTSLLIGVAGILSAERARLVSARHDPRI